MRLARLVGASGLLLAVGLAGCGAEAKKGTTAEEKAAGKAIGAGFRNMRQQLRDQAVANAAVNRKGKVRARSGP